MSLNVHVIHFVFSQTLRKRNEKQNHLSVSNRIIPARDLFLHNIPSNEINHCIRKQLRKHGLLMQERIQVGDSFSHVPQSQLSFTDCKECKAKIYTAASFCFHVTA